MSTAIAEPISPAPGSTALDAEAAYRTERGKPVPGSEHAICQMRLGHQFMNSDRHLVLSELNLELSGKRLIPDLSIYDSDQETQVRHLIWIKEPPRMAVEIISPSQTLEEMGARIEQLLAGGVRSVWLVVPFTKVISIYQKDAPLISAVSGLLTDPVTGLSVTVEEIFS